MPTTRSKATASPSKAADAEAPTVHSPLEDSVDPANEKQEASVVASIVTDPEFVDKDDSDPPQAVAVLPRPAMGKTSCLFLRTTPYWKHPTTGEWQFTKEDVPSVLQTIAFEQFGGTNFNKLRWRPKAWKTRDRTATKRWVHRCGYEHSSKCPFVLEEVYSINTQLTYFRCSIVPHKNHTKVKTHLRAVPSQIRAMVSSPSVFKLQPARFISRLQEKGVATMSLTDINKAKRWFRRTKKSASLMHLQDSEAGSYGALAETLEGFKKENISPAEFDDHTVFLVGDYCIESEDLRHYAIFSTNNLLLNAYRQLCTGQDMFIAIDTSYRYTIEGFAVMPLMVASPTMEGRRLAYALVSNEDEAIHTSVLDLLRDEVESVVNEKIQAGVKYI